LKQRRPAEIFIDEIVEWDGWDGARRLANAPRSAEADFLDAVPNQEIKSAMATLPEGSRTAIYYADVLDYTYAETAVLMDIPIGTVMSRVSRGRKRLRFALGHLAGDCGDISVLEPDIA
jgi:RNA polymerase sigma-70 factor (ECF subfamily)